MPLLQRTVEVERPLEEVFAFVGDFGNAPRWDPGVADARRRTTGPIGVGTRYELWVRTGGRVLPMTYEIVTWEPPTRVVLHGRGSTVTSVDDIRFERAGSGTRIRYAADIRLRFPLRPLEPLLRGRFEAIADAAMAGLRRVLGSDNPTRSD